MRAFVRRHLGTSTAIVLGLATLVGGIGWIWPDSRDWFVAHGGTGWLVALALIVVAIEIWIVSDRDVARVQVTQGQLEGSIAGEREAHARALREEQVRSRSQLEAKDREIADLTARLHPTVRDIEQFRRIEEWLPWKRGTMVWLESSFTGDHWTDKQSGPLYQLEGDLREWFFDDETVNEAFDNFRSAVSALTDWTAGNASPDHHSNTQRDPDAPWVYTIRQPREREDGYAGYDQDRRVGSDLARQVVEQRRNLEVVARSRGL